MQSAKKSKAKKVHKKEFSSIIVMGNSKNTPPKEGYEVTGSCYRKIGDKPLYVTC